MIVFLGLNRVELDAPQESATAIVLSLAAGEIGEDALANWIAGHSRPLAAPGIAP
jgi:death-on-curing protein